MAVTTRGGKSDEAETKGGAGKKGRGAVKKSNSGAAKKNNRKKSVGKTNRLALVNIPESEVHSNREYCSV